MTTVRVEFDASEVRRHAADLEEAPHRLQRDVPKMLRRLIGPKFEDEIRQDADDHRYLTHLPSEASNEMLGQFSMEAGINYRGQGKLAHIIVNGSVNNGPVYDFMAGPRRAIPFAEQVLAGVAEDAVLGGPE